VPLSCEHYQDDLLDMSLGELSEARAAAVREHVAGCPACRGDLADLTVANRLAAQLPMMTPGRGTESLLEAARARAAAVGVPVSTEETNEPADGPLRALVRWLSGLAVGPQVAMATLMLLVVAIGLSHLPRLRNAPDASGGSIVGPDTAGEAAASPELQPAEPLALELDRRAQRIRSRGEGGGEKPLAAAEEAVGRAGTSSSEAERGGTLDEVIVERNVEAIAFAGDDAEGELDPGVEQAAARPRARATREAQLESRRSPPLAGARGVQPSLANSDLDTQGAGVALPPAPAERDGTAATTLARARQLRGAGRCQEAVLYYREVLRAHPDHPALLEAADCYARIGQRAHAEALLATAERVPTLRSEAQRQRTQMMTPTQSADVAAEPAQATTTTATE
jgi:hypothetical protein